jgi:SHS2 domain-containing protein
MHYPQWVAASHRFEEHTGEVRLELAASTCEDLFAEAGRALAEIMLGPVPEPPASAPPPRPIEVRAPDRAALLVEWLNELIFLAETSKQVLTRFRVDSVDDLAVRAAAWGVEPEAIKTAVKAATLHQLALERSTEGWRASVVLDV